MEIVTKFISNFVVLTVGKGHPNFYSISQMLKRGEKWTFIPFLRQIDDKDLFIVISQYKAWRDAGEPKREPL